MDNQQEQVLDSSREQKHLIKSVSALSRLRDKVLNSININDIITQYLEWFYHFR